MSKLVPRDRMGSVTAMSAVASFAIHGGMLAAALTWSRVVPGAIELQTEAVSIELTMTELLESIEASPTVEALASPESARSETGTPSDSIATLSPPEALTELPVHGAAAQTAAGGMEVVSGSLEAQEQPLSTPGPTTTEPHDVEAVPAQPTHQTRRLESATPPQGLARKGAAQSRATKGSAYAAGRVSASKGSAINYAALVRARVAGRRPPGGGRRGSVVVSFGLAHSGALAFASVARSSGDTVLDHSVLSAVRGAAPFPAPPTGASRRFTMPFYFR